MRTGSPQAPRLSRFVPIPRKGSIAHKVLLSIVLFSSFVTLIITAYQLYDDYRTQVAMVDQRMRQIELSYGESLGNAIWFLDTKQIESTLAGIMKFEDVHYVGVRIREGETLDTGDPRPDESVRRHEVDVLHALEGRNINVGRLYIESNIDGVISRLGEKGWLILVSQAIKTFFVSFFILFIIYKLLTRHLSTISEFAAALSIEEKDNFLSLGRKRNDQPDELDHISDAMNQMKQGLIDDAEERARAEEKLRTLWQAVEQSSASVLILDAEGIIEFVNSRFTRATGFEPEDVIGKKSDRICFGKKSKEEYADIWESISSAGEWRGELNSQCKDGSSFWEAATMSAVTSDGGTVTHYLLLRDDISEVRQLKEQLELERDYLREEVKTKGHYGEIIGDSSALRETMSQVESVAKTNASVIILGESGVGKEMIARAIQSQSDRADKPMVKVNCASVPQELFESEFFGHVQGSFTGAHKDRIGRLQLADGGTLFLDEVGEIPLAQQGKLLRALQENEFERIGGNTTISVDVRIIAATNRDLRAEIEAGRFREDLYYRLSVFPIEVPPLRDRTEDIIPLAISFLDIACKELGREALRLTRNDARILESHHWRGNVRELKNIIERAVISTTGEKLVLDIARTNKNKQSFDPAEESKHPSKGYLTNDEFRIMERDNIIAALKHANWKTFGDDGAASLLGVKPTTLSYQIKTFGIVKPKK